MTSRRAAASVAGLVLGLLAVLFTPASPALAHAALVDTNPPAGAVLTTAPAEVVLTFSENIRLVPQRSRIIAPDGTRADSGNAAARGANLHIPVSSGTVRGTYLVTYRVISADSHPVAGTVTFSVGAPSTTPTGDDPTDVTDPVVATALGAARYTGFVGLILMVGPALFLSALWPRRLSRRGPLRLLMVGVGLLTVGTLAELYLQAPYQAGTGLFGVGADDVREIFNSPYGIAHVVRVGLVAAVTVLLPPVVNRSGNVANGADGGASAGLTDRLLLGVLAVGALVTWPVSGHPAATVLPALSVVTDLVHLGAMSVWVGGLVMLFGFVLRTANERELSAILPVWSRWALIAVSALVFAGTVQALVTVGSPAALLGTRYGQLLAAKVALLAAVLTAAWYARRLVYRRTRAAGADNAGPAGQASGPGGQASGPRGQASGPGAGSGRRQLRRTVLAELAGTAAILAVTAALVQTTPARAAQDERIRQDAGPYSATLTSSLYSLQVQVDPGQAGENTVHLFAYTPAGAPLKVVEWRATAALASQGIEPAELPLLVLTDNHALAQAQLPIAGTWEVRFTLRTTEIDQATVTARVPIR